VSESAHDTIQLAAEPRPDDPRITRRGRGHTRALTRLPDDESTAFVVRGHLGAGYVFDLRERELEPLVRAEREELPTVKSAGAA
jgi:hypothetical protein